jgi:hypothetical protein
VIRSFGHYTWAGVMGETTIEDGKAGDQVGAIRRFEGGGGSVRQVLLAHSDIDRSYTYAFCDPSALEVRNYVATIRITRRSSRAARLSSNGRRSSTAPPRRPVTGSIISSKKDSQHGSARFAGS